MTILLPIYSVLLTIIQVSIPMFSMSWNILAMSEFTSGGRHIGFQDGRQLFYITLYLTYYCTLEENKDYLHLGKYLLSGNCHHMAAISEFKMATTLLNIQFSMIYRCRLPCQLSLRKLLYRYFAQMAAIFNFPMTAALPVLFRVIEHTKMHIHVSYFQSPTYNKY